LLHGSDDQETGFSINLEELSTLEAKGNYITCIRLVESSIVQWASRVARDEYLDKKRRLWRQLVLISNKYATNSIEQRKYAKAMGE
jgi:TorA maturation chaperone TorD